MANLAVVAWIGVQRAWRGEHVAAHKYVRYHLPDAVLNLAQTAGLLEAPEATLLDPWRRLERGQPQLGLELHRALLLPAEAAATGILDLAMAYVQPRRPDTAWSAVAEVWRWIHEGWSRSEPNRQSGATGPAKGADGE